MSHFLYNESCPRCRKNGSDRQGDNLAVYSDGHKYCFKCNYFKEGDKLYVLRTNSDNRNVKKDFKTLNEFSLDALNWFKKYELTNDEIYAYFLPVREGWCFKTDNFNLIRDLYAKPKVRITGDVVGNEPLLHKNNTLVLVEDVVSMIKVSRHFSSCALLKATIHDKLLIRLAKDYDNLVLWLDPDMYMRMVDRLKPKCDLLFKKVKVVLSEKDPKEHNDIEILKYIDNI